MKMIGIKLADGSFYPLLEEGIPAKKTLDLTTARDNQTAIMVDLYRSETNSMEDAEYAATLKIDNLVAHPNGEPDISFTVALDEENKLFAEINDGESGARNTVTVSLVERAETEHSGSDNQYGPAITAGAALAAGGLMYAASKKKAEDNPIDFSDLDLPEELDLTKPVSATAESVSDTANNVSDIPPEGAAVSQAESSSTETPEKSGFDADSFDALGDVRFDDIDISAFDEAPQTEQTIDATAGTEQRVDFASTEISSAAESAAVGETDDFHFEVADLPSFDELTVQKADDKTSFESSEDNAVFGAADIPASKDVFSDTKASADVQSTSDGTDDFHFDAADLPSFDEVTTEKTQDGNDTVDLSDGTDDFHFDAADLPVFDETPSAQNDAPDMDAASGSDSFSDDFFAGIDMPTNETNAAARDIDSLDDLEFGETDDTKTQEGTTATKYQPEKTIKKKTKVPVLICLLCALICVIATILILFVIPSKYNVLLSRASHQNDVFVLPQRDTAVPPQETQVLPAKPDEIVVAPKAEVLVPVRPAAASKSTGDIVYRIKWGDTLWDIADAYYKNPWRYPRIARYNNIRNPDYIISGTTIRIPAE